MKYSCVRISEPPGKPIKDCRKVTVTLTLLADTDRFADHTFHVELIDDKGKINPAFNDVVLGKGNKAFYRFRKPLNARGKWKLQVCEALTSVSRTVDIP